MPFCTYASTCNSPSEVYFKGHFFCLNHARAIKAKLEHIISEKEKRENRVLAPSEKISVNNLRYAIDEFQRLIKLRGTRMVITKEELVKLC